MWFFLSLFFALWTSISISIVKLLTKNISTITLLFVINLFILPFMLVILFATGGIPHFTTKFFILMLVSSILDVIAALLSFRSIKDAPISLISPISSFNPVFTTLTAALFLREVPSNIKFIGIVVIVAGSYLLNIADIKAGVFAPFKKLFSNRAVLLFLTANFLWAITPIFQKIAIFETSPVTPLFPSFFGALLITLLILPFGIKRARREVKFIRRNIGWFLLLAPFATLAQWAAFTAFSLTNLGYVTAVLRLSTLFIILWGWLFFKEERIKERLLGASVMILGTILLVI